MTIQRVIDNFDIKYPQAREDLKLLEELYGLSTHRNGRVKVWTWAGFDPDYISVATAASLELGSVALDLFRGTPYRDEIERLAAHCRGRVGDGQQDRLSRVSNALHLRRTWLPVDEERVSHHVEDILDAVFKDRRLAMVYERADGEVHHYVTTPQKMIWYKGRLWLLARHEGQAKLFDIAGIEKLEEIAAPDKDGTGNGANGEIELEEYFTNAFGIYAQNYPVADIHIEVQGAWANYLRRYRVHPSQRNEEGEDTLHVFFKMGLCPEFKSFLLGMLPNVKIYEPTELAEELRDVAQLSVEQLA